MVTSERYNSKQKLTESAANTDIDGVKQNQTSSKTVLPKTSSLEPEEVSEKEFMFKMH